MPSYTNQMRLKRDSHKAVAERTAPRGEPRFRSALRKQVFSTIANNDTVRPKASPASVYTGTNYDVLEQQAVNRLWCTPLWEVLMGSGRDPYAAPCSVGDLAKGLMISREEWDARIVVGEFYCRKVELSNTNIQRLCADQAATGLIEGMKHPSAMLQALRWFYRTQGNGHEICLGGSGPDEPWETTSIASSIQPPTRDGTTHIIERDIQSAKSYRNLTSTVQCLRALPGGPLSADPLLIGQAT
ncbi:hypothetical protein LTR12_017182 [Friedmanniomyces endolithicus]|nr:hypothetical protein LTR74_016221 [Friedmanniomyces endolithicus]KAK1808454.1 hypothetical protein LTR12_017182 [Friedmanniomyces endolithicus]